MDAEAYIGGRALPTIINFSANMLEVIHFLDYINLCMYTLCSNLLSCKQSHAMIFLSLKGFLNYLHILPSRKKPLPILHDVSGIIKPGR